MLKFKEITIEDKEIIDSYFKKMGYQNSEACFTTMFIWKDVVNIRFTIEDGFLLLTGQYKNHPPYAYFPTGEGDLKGVIEKLMEYFNHNGKKRVIKPLLDSTKKMVEELFPGKFSYREIRYSSDYIYLAEDLINLKGKKYHAKKNHLNKFISTYDYEYVNIYPDEIKKYHEFMNNILDPDSIDEKIAMDNYFNNYSHFDNNKGAALIVNGQIAAITFGEQLNSDTAVIHIEKANTDFQGSYAAINQMFVKNEWAHLKYINREEDMGIEGLRRAKMSYRPIYILDKYEAVQI